MSWHPTEEDLILHYYSESTAEESLRVDDHLRVCSACGAAWQELTDTLTAVSSAATPEPPEGFERVMWAHISPALPSRASGWLSRRFVVAGGLAAGMAMAVLSGYLWIQLQSDDTLIVPAVVDTSSPSPRAARERVLLTAMNDHLSQMEILFVELLNSPRVEQAELDFERMTADDLVTSGRLYRETARQNGNVRYVQLLDDLEPVLVEVARSPERVGPQDIESLRTRIADNELLFKVRAVTAEVRDRQQTLMLLQ